MKFLWTLLLIPILNLTPLSLTYASTQVSFPPYVIPIPREQIAVVATNNPITTITPKATTIVYKKTHPIRATSNGNCVQTLKNAGYLPNKPVTKNGLAKTIPVKPLKLGEGEKAVIKTAEGWTGHVLLVTKIGGKLVSTVEGGYRNGVGRVVNPKVVVGEVSL